MLRSPLARQFAGKTLADHCAQAFSTLSQRYCHTMHRAGAVHGPANRRQVFLELVRSVRLRPHQDATWLERALDIGERASRIRHIVDAIEGHHQVEAVGGGNVLRGELLEDKTIADSGTRRLCPRSRDRRGVNVIAGEARMRIAGGDRHDTLAGAASDLSDISSD